MYLIDHLDVYCINLVHYSVNSLPKLK